MAATGGNGPGAPRDTRGVRDATDKEDGLRAYAVERAIGRGHFSTVHKAVHIASGRPVAVKKIQVFESMDAKSRERCLKEVELLQSLESHPCIIEYIDAFLDADELYIVFEWAAHGDLRRLMKRAIEARVLFDEAHIWRYFVQVCDAIRHMHAHRIMHRDIKPANIFLSAEGAIKLGDLGLGRAFSSQTFEAMSKVGTPLYMSPEVLNGSGYEWKSDVWSLGVLLYELAALRSPFKAEGDNLYMLFQKISKGAYEPIGEHFSPTLRETIASTLRVDAKQRPDVTALLEVARHAALAASIATAAQQASDARAPDAGLGGADAFVVMEAAHDKLKLLDYEQRFERRGRAAGAERIERATFATRARNPRAQFVTFCRLLDWLATDVCGLPPSDVQDLLPAAMGDAHFETAAVAAGASALGLLRTMAAPLDRAAGDLAAAAAAGADGGGAGHAAAQAPLPSAMLAELSAAKLAAGGGIAVCAALNLALDAALLASGFEWRVPRFGADEASPPPELDELGSDDGRADALPAADWDEEEEADEEKGGVAAGAGGERADGAREAGPPVYAQLPAEVWAAEAERVAPRLRLQLRAADAARAGALSAHAPWRARARHARAELAVWDELWPRVEQHGARRAAEVSAAAALEMPLVLAARESEAAMSALAARVDEASRLLQARVAELDAVDADLARTKRALEGRGLELSDDRAVASIKRAVRELRAEAATLATRVATAQAQLTRRSIALAHAAGARAGGPAGALQLGSPADGRRTAGLSGHDLTASSPPPARVANFAKGRPGGRSVYDSPGGGTVR